MTKSIASVATVLAILMLGGCATSFQGSAHIEGGRAGCEKKCAGQGLAMDGLVYMGEYSSACVCTVPGSGGGSASASVAGAATGVVLQMRAQQQQATYYH